MPNRSFTKFMIGIFLLFPTYLFAQQAKKPTLMILPSDNRCTVRYFTKTYDNQGGKVVSADYCRAFLEDSELSPVINKEYSNVYNES